MPMKTEPDAEALRICFICTGNTCRSPMAAAVAAFYAAQQQDAFGDRRFEITSAGLYANEGEPIAAHAVEALEAERIEPTQGWDYHLHRAHTVTAEEIERADWLVCMSGSHCMELLMRYPNAAQKITAMPTPIADPYGGDLSVYRICLSQIIAGVKQLLFPSTDGQNGENEI